MMRLLRDTDCFPQIDKVKLQGDLFYIALNGEELLGYCRFRRGKETLYITGISDGGDAAVGDGLLRAALAYGMDGGAEKALFGDFLNIKRYAPFGFHLDEKNCINSLYDFLNNCQSCKTEE